MKQNSNLSKEEINDEISLKEIIVKFREIFHYLLRYWILIILVGIIGACIGLAYASTRKVMYTAKYSFALEDEQTGGLSGALGLASQFGFSLGGTGGGAFSGDNLIELMKSRSLIQKALLSPITKNNKTQSLIEYYIDFNEFRKEWVNKPELQNLSFPLNANISGFSREQDSVIMNIHETITRNLLSVEKVDKKLSIITVAVKSSDELFAKNFSEALVNEVSRFYVDTKTKKSLGNVAILQHQTDSIRGELNRAITGVAQSSDNILNLNPSRQILRIPSQKKQIDVQANTAILTELVKNLEISKLALRRETPLIQTIDKPILPLRKERLGRLKGLLIGGLLAGFLIVIYLFGKKIIIDILR